MDFKSHFIYPLLFIFILSPFFSQNNKKEDFSFSLEPNISLSYGNLGEYLFSNSQKDFIISHLEWETKALAKAGLKINSEWKKINLSLGGDIALPIICGQMINSDYDPFYKHKTMLGLSDNLPKLNFYLFAELFYQIDFAEGFSFAPAIKIKYNHNSFTSKNGQGWYGKNEITWDNEKATYHPKLSHIDYKKQSLIYYAGLKLKYKSKKFSFSTATFFSPYAFFYTMDYHSDENNTNQDFHTLSNQEAWFKGINQTFDLEYKIDQNKIISLNCQISHCPIIRGITVTDRFRGNSYGSDIFNTDWVISSQDTGSSFFDITISSGIKLSF